jgi:medium-chain acyl-[acyl-carrier-protein] hydrolase
MNGASTSVPQSVFQAQSSEAKLRLFCFPYAGAGASAFRDWPKFFTPEIEVVPVQLPGRESRIRERALTRIGPLVELLAGDLGDLNTAFAFFGHSMGALVGYELARKLSYEGKPAPVHVFVSARRDPSILDENPPLHRLDDVNLLEKLRELNGTPKEIFQYPDLVSFWLAILRADLEVCETYVCTDAAPLECPITAFCGLEDAHVRRDDMAAWRNRTRGAFNLHLLPGDHFFLHTSRDILLRTIARSLSATVNSGGGSLKGDRFIGS